MKHTVGHQFHPPELSALAKRVAAIAVLALCSVAAADEQGDFAAYRNKALSHLQRQCSDILAARKGDPWVKSFRQRLEMIDEVSGLLLRRFQATMGASLDTLLESVEPASETGSSVAPAKVTVGAMEILDKYADPFARGFGKASVTSQELKVLQEYYDTSVKVCGQYIAERGRVLQAIRRKDAVDVLELCLVMPFLHVPDPDWSEAEIDALADWMRKPENLKAIEDFSLRAYRPFTAYQVSVYRDKAGAEELRFLDYVPAAARGLIKGREYRAAIHCLKTGVRHARTKHQDSAAVALQLQFAELLDGIGHAELAAGEAKQVLEAYPGSAERGRAAVLRLKYLYKTGGFSQIIKEAPKYQAEEGCKAYLPQIVYISWVTHRRQNRMAEADRLQKSFLARFGKHPLAADMYFASAMAALARSDYGEASRLLEIIEYRYPKSRLMPKVKKIRTQLGKVAGTGNLSDRKPGR